MTIRHRPLLWGLGLALLTFGAACGEGGGQKVSLGSDGGALDGDDDGQAGEQTPAAPTAPPPGKTDPPAEPQLASFTYGGGDTFNSCTTTWGDPAGSQTVCHYPGPDSCTFTETADARCVTCAYPDGSGKQLCLLDPNDPTPDPLSGRPAGLPAPGQCVTERRERIDEVVCTTCTREDGSATMTCKHPPAEACGPVDPGAAAVACVGCLGYGILSQVTFCDPPAR